MPALPVDTLKLSFYGTMNTTQDWSVGLTAAVLLGSGSWAPANLSNALTGMGTPIGAWWQALRPHISPTTIMRGVRGYFIPAGQIHASSQGEWLYGSGVPGSSGQYMPDYVALVQSLRSDVPGRSGRGRMYVPCTGVVCGTDNQADNTTVGDYATATSTLITALNAFTDVPDNLTSMKIVVPSHSKAQVNDVATVIVDSKIDVQRRREDKIVATHTAVATV